MPDLREVAEARIAEQTRIMRVWGAVGLLSALVTISICIATIVGYQMPTFLYWIGTVAFIVCAARAVSLSNEIRSRRAAL